MVCLYQINILCIHFHCFDCVFLLVQTSNSLTNKSLQFYLIELNIHSIPSGHWTNPWTNQNHQDSQNKKDASRLSLNCSQNYKMQGILGADKSHLWKRRNTKDQTTNSSSYFDLFSESWFSAQFTSSHYAFPDFLMEQTGTMVPNNVP